MENGLGHAGTHLLVNEFRMQNGQESVGLSAVCGMVKKLNPKVDEVGRRKQGSTDPESAWAGARLNWVTQLLICLGEIKLSSDNTPEYLQDLPSLSIQQIAFWDEVHKEQIVGFKEINHITFLAMQMEDTMPMAPYRAMQAAGST